MKTKNLPVLLTLTVCGSALLVSACGKKEAPPAPPATEAQPSTETVTSEAEAAATNAATEIQQTADETKQAAEAAVTNVQQATEEQAADVQAQVQSLMDRAKALVAEKNYPEALNSLKTLSNLKLTEEQQKWVDDLKAQIQKAMAEEAASNATKSVGGLLGQ